MKVLHITNNYPTAQFPVFWNFRERANRIFKLRRD